MRVVLDTNVIISALLFRGRPEQALIRCLGPDISFITSEHLLAEVEDVLRRKSNWDEERINGSLERLRNAADIVSPAAAVNICRDPDDNRILEAAVAGRADCIVSGDADLLSMKAFQQIPILTVSAFLELTER